MSKILCNHKSNIAWPYDEALQWMHEAHSLVAENSEQIFLGVGSHKETVITAGRDKAKAILHEGVFHSRPDILYRVTERGGGLTAHEPGQLVLYPVLNLKAQDLKVSQYLSLLESTMLSFVESFGLKAEKNLKGPGIFIDNKKVGFVGVRLSQGISTHGIAINLKNDCTIFKSFAPCGYDGLKVCCIKDFCPVPLSLGEYAEKLARIFVELFRT